MEAGTSLGEGRDEHAAGVVARSDHPQQRLAWERNWNQQQDSAGKIDRALLGISGAGVLEQDAKRGLRAAEQLVGGGGLLDREAMGDQRLSADSACSQGVENGLEVALLSPAHETNGVVVAMLLISRVVATGAVGAAHLERKLLFVEKIATQIQAGDANQHNAASLATGLGSNVHWLTGGGGGSDQHTIHADTTCLLQAPGNRINARGEVEGRNTEIFCQSNTWKDQDPGPRHGNPGQPTAGQ